MDRCIPAIYGWLISMALVCFDNLELCSCKPIESAVDNLDLVACVVQLIIPKGPASDAQQMPGSYKTQLVNILSSEGPIAKKEKGTATEYAFPSLCVSRQPSREITSDVEVRQEGGSVATENVLQTRIFTNVTKRHINKREAASSLGRSSNGMHRRRDLPHISSWLWKRQRNNN